MSVYRKLLAQPPRLLPEPEEGRSSFDEIPRYQLSKRDYFEFKASVLARVLSAKLGYDGVLVEQLDKKALVDLLLRAQVQLKTYSRRSFILRFGGRADDLLSLLEDPESSGLYASALSVPRSEVKRREGFVPRPSPPEVYKTPEAKIKTLRTPKGPLAEQFAADGLEEHRATGRERPLMEDAGQEIDFNDEEHTEVQHLAEKAAAANEAYVKATAVAKRARKAAKTAARNAKKAQEAATAIRSSTEPVGPNTQEGRPAAGDHLPGTHGVDMLVVIREQMASELEELKKRVAEIANGLNHLTYVLAAGAPSSSPTDQ